MSKELRGAVYSRYKTISSFAKALGWSYGKTHRIVNNEQSPSADEMCKMAEVLGVTTREEFVRIFFTQESTLWTK